MDAVLVIGRILFALIFVTSGIAHFAKLEAMTGYAQYKKLPAAKLGVMISGLFFLLGGIYIAAGFWVDLGALLLAITLILAAVIFHNFWKETDPTAKQNEMIAFNKDIALAGAALILFALIAWGTLTEFGPSVGNLAFFNF
ncbi:MAG: DoxX family protein [Candidatus Planktophila sp.]|nr:DoxX family protein [Candidatus Planktophila sp.]MSO24600.1 DoxX family protein [Candidatus Planktophila sp.]PHX70020.1 MAG: DoxX family protein [Actinomycetota bacterium]